MHKRQRGSGRHCVTRFALVSAMQEAASTLLTCEEREHIGCQLRRAFPLPATGRFDDVRLAIMKRDPRLRLEDGPTRHRLI